MPKGSEPLCPRCNVPLKEVCTSGRVLYACDRCDGRAVTIELLRKRFTPESINALWLHAVEGHGRIGPRCPLCRQPMIDVALSDHAEIEVDVCSHCHFVCFDAHEVETLVPRQSVRAAPELPQKARELLAIAEVERLSKQAEGSDLDSAAAEESWKQIAAWESSGFAGFDCLPGSFSCFGFCSRSSAHSNRKAGMSSVSSAAHLGGAAVGILAWLLWRPNNEAGIGTR